MIRRPSAVAAELRTLFQDQRDDMKKCGFDERHNKSVLRRLNEFEAMALSYIESKLIFFKYHFNHLWGENWFHCYSSRKAHQKHNTGSLFIERAMRNLGEANGWLPKSDPKYANWSPVERWLKET